MLHLLLDEHLSPRAAVQLRRCNAQLPVMALREWEGGRYLESDDSIILRVAHVRGLTLDTRDARTIAPLLSKWGKQQQDHGGVIFVDHKTIPERDIGGLVLALLELFDEHGDEGWVNRTEYLRRAVRKIDLA